MGVRDGYVGLLAVLSTRGAGSAAGRTGSDGAEDGAEDRAVDLGVGQVLEVRVDQILDAFRHPLTLPPVRPGGILSGLGYPRFYPRGHVRTCNFVVVIFVF